MMFEKIDFDAELERYSDKLDSMQSLIISYDKLDSRGQEFAGDLIQGFQNTGALSAKQWEWVGKLVARVEGAQPLYGNFNPIHVAFQIAGEHLQCPKVRLVTEEGRFVQLNFYPETKTIKVMVDGWQGHGYRKFAGVIENDMIKPYDRERLSDDVRMAIETLANDPIGAAKAFAAKLGCCMYCGNRLSDDESKRRGYGPTCASHYNLPWGKKAGEAA